MEFRDQHGPFGTIDALDAVPGIGPPTLTVLRGLVTVGGAAPTAPRAPAPAHDGAEHAHDGESGGKATATVPIDVNTAGADELQRLPGIGPARAAAIVADRERNGPFSSCADLARVTGIGPATVASVGERCATSPSPR